MRGLRAKNALLPVFIYVFYKKAYFLFFSINKLLETKLRFTEGALPLSFSIFFCYHIIGDIEINAD